MTVGGGIRSADDIGRALRSGATSGHTAGSSSHSSSVNGCRLGQCVVASIDAKRRAETTGVMSEPAVGGLRAGRA